jgi:hypothetical protein
MAAKRVNVTLDAEYAEKLSRIARRAHVSEGTLARSFLSTAIDQADPDPQAVTELLLGIPGFIGGLGQAEREVERGEAVPLDDLDQL